jgi:LPS O-antigen subunit length determinant protein (WzzB/FepE family)
MVQYTIPQSPEIVIAVRGKDSPKARDKAMDKLMDLMDEGKLETKLADGFGPDQFVEVKQTQLDLEKSDDPVTEAVQILNSLATLKLKLAQTKEEALQVRQQIDILFSDAPVTEEQINQLKDGFKVLKSFAQANQRYLEARSQAETARTILDQALSNLE